MRGAHLAPRPPSERLRDLPWHGWERLRLLVPLQAHPGEEIPVSLMQGKTTLVDHWSPYLQQPHAAPLASRLGGPAASLVRLQPCDCPVLQFAEWCLAYGTHGCRIPDRPYSLFEGMSDQSRLPVHTGSLFSTCAAALLKIIVASLRSSWQAWREPFSSCPNWQTLRRPAFLPLSCDPLLVWTEEEGDRKTQDTGQSDQAAGRFPGLMIMMDPFSLVLY